MLSLEHLLKGFFLSLCVVVAIGPQNAFIIRQSLRKNYIFFVPFLCSVFDILLIICGVKGISLIINNYPNIIDVVTWTGIIFLYAYGGFSFYSISKNRVLDLEFKSKTKRPLSELILLILVFTFLNPSVYIDTFVILGSVGGRFDEIGQINFIIGASIASVVWFFFISITSSMLSDFFTNPKAWKILDFFVGVLMWIIATNILLRYKGIVGT